MKKKLICSVILFLALIPMLLHSDYVTEGARYGLLLWYQSVVPALFPFMVLSGLIVAQGGVQILMTPIYQVLKYIIPITKDGCYVLLSGLLCGYPMGAKTCSDFVYNKQISLDEAKFLMTICNHPSPMFILGYVYPYFSETFETWKLLLSVYGPIPILALISSRYYCHSSSTGKLKDWDQSAKWSDSTRPGDEIFQKHTQIPPTTDETILSAATILCKIGGYLVLFSIMIVFLRNIEWLQINLRLFFIGCLEMTTGIRELASSCKPVPAFIASVAALTFGGISGICQTNAVLNEKKAGLSIRPYIIWKLIHTSLSTGIAVILCSLSY